MTASSPWLLSSTRFHCPGLAFSSLNENGLPCLRRGLAGERHDHGLMSPPVNKSQLNVLYELTDMQMNSTVFHAWLWMLSKHSSLIRLSLQNNRLVDNTNGLFSLPLTWNTSQCACHSSSGRSSPNLSF